MWEVTLFGLIKVSANLTRIRIWTPPRRCREMHKKKRHRPASVWAGISEAGVLPARGLRGARKGGCRRVRNRAHSRRAPQPRRLTRPTSAVDNNRGYRHHRARSRSRSRSRPPRDRGEGGRRVCDALLRRAPGRTEAVRFNYTTNALPRPPRRGAGYEPRLRFRAGQLHTYEVGATHGNESILRP